MQLDEIYQETIRESSLNFSADLVNDLRRKKEKGRIVFWLL
jgi:hypothetical protein